MGAGALLTFAATSSANAALFALTSFGNELVTVDPTTGQATEIRSLGENVAGFDLATYNGRLYTFSDSTNSIREINPYTAQLVSSIDIGAGDQVGEGALAISGTGMGFFSSANDSSFSTGGMNRLYSFNLVTMTSALVTQTEFVIDALAFSSGGTTLYAIGQAEGRLFTIDQLTGAVTVVGELGLTPAQQNPFAGLAFGDDGTLYGALDDRLYTIDTTTGAATAVNPGLPDFGIGVASVSGLVFAVPEPSSVGLGVMGTAMLLIRRKRRASDKI